MPFDDMSIRTKPEIALLDKMAQILAKPEHWCKSAMVSRNDRYADNQYCLYGALTLASYGMPICAGEYRSPKGYQFATSEARAVHMAIANLAPTPPDDAVKERAGVYYNNADTTTHADILAFIGKVREHFEQEALAAA